LPVALPTVLFLAERKRLILLKVNHC